MKFIESTTRELFQRLEREGLCYAVLRNYADLFTLQRANGSFTDIDLVIAPGDIPRWREIVVEVAAEQGWDAVTECGHWARSPVKCHNIEVFRIYHRDPLFCVQIDLFHGLLVHGMPFINEKELLAGRFYDETRGITRIDPLHENLFHLVQIAGLYPESLPKIERYRRKVLDYVAVNREVYRERLKALFGPASGPVLDAITEGDLGRFQKVMSRARAYFAVQYIARHPLQIPAMVFHRLRDGAGRFYTDQCGSVVRIHAPREETRRLLRSVLNDMVQHCFMDEWVEKDQAVIGWSEHRLMEQGAWIVVWSESHDAMIDLSDATDRAAVTEQLWSYLIPRHQVLHSATRVPAGMVRK